MTNETPAETPIRTGPGRRPTPGGPPLPTQITLRLPRKLLEALDLCAQEAGEDRSTLARTLIRNALHATGWLP